MTVQLLSRRRMISCSRYLAKSYLSRLYVYAVGNGQLNNAEFKTFRAVLNIM